MLTVGSLFSGIGGLDLGLERAGMRVLWQCESDPYCRAVLRKHWPETPIYPDVRLLADSDASDGSAESREQQAQWTAIDASGSARVLAVPDVLCGGFPCQPVSFAGRRRGAADERWLWPEFARLIRLLRPRYALMENVPGLLAGGMAEVLGDLAAVGYDAEWDSIAAAHVGAPHLRYRVFIVAYAGRRHSERWGVTRFLGSSQGAREGEAPQWERIRNPAGDRGTPLAYTDSSNGHGRRESDEVGRIWQSSGYAKARHAGRTQWGTEPDVGRVAHGVPSRVDRLRALGNAVVPQVAEVIGRMIVNDAG